MVAFDDEIAFGDITKGDFSSPLQKFVTPPPHSQKEGHVDSGLTPPHKTPAQWRILSASKDALDRRGTRPPISRESRDLWEPDARLVARQIDLQLKSKELEVKTVELRIQEQRERNTLVEIELRAAELKLVRAKPTPGPGFARYPGTRGTWPKLGQKSRTRTQLGFKKAKPKPTGFQKSQTQTHRVSNALNPNPTGFQQVQTRTRPGFSDFKPEPDRVSERPHKPGPWQFHSQN